MNWVYVESFCPVAERASNLRKTVSDSQSGMTLSMPTTATCRSGMVEHIRPLPSLVTMTSVPVSATRKLPPVIPISALKNFSRRVSRAIRASSIGSVGALISSFSLNNAAISSYMGWTGAGQLNNIFAEICLDGLNPSLFEKMIQTDLLCCHGLGLDRCPDIVLFGDLEH